MDPIQHCRLLQQAGQCRVQHARHACRALDYLAQIGRCHSGEAIKGGHRGREWLLQQRRQLLLHAVQSDADSSHLAVEELHKAVGCSLSWDGKDRVVVLVRRSLMTLYASLCVAEAMVVRK